jgi:hypothetical protein
MPLPRTDADRAPVRCAPSAAEGGKKKPGPHSVRGYIFSHVSGYAARAKGVPRLYPVRLGIGSVASGRNRQQRGAISQAPTKFFPSDQVFFEARLTAGGMWWVGCGLWFLVCGLSGDARKCSICPPRTTDPEPTTTHHEPQTTRHKPSSTSDPPLPTPRSPFPAPHSPPAAFNATAPAGR